MPHRPTFVTFSTALPASGNRTTQAMGMWFSVPTQPSANLVVNVGPVRATVAYPVLCILTDA